MSGEGLSDMAKYYLAQIRQTIEVNRAAICSHGVRREHCKDHSKAETEETP
jgi:hypothetical protein